MIWSIVFCQVFNTDSIILGDSPLAVFADMESIQLVIFGVVFGGVGQQLGRKWMHNPPTLLGDLDLKWKHHNNHAINFENVVTGLQHHDLLHGGILGGCSEVDRVHLGVQFASYVQQIR
jgi:hypothetical protein